MNNPKFIIIHCSATPAGRDVTASDVDAWHRAQGFKGIGYHYFIRLDGTIERGRADLAEGAHCPQEGMNRRSISICYAGGYAADGKTPADTRTPEQKKSIITVIRTLRGRYGRLPVIGHRDVKGVAKACPCFAALHEYSKL